MRLAALTPLTFDTMAQAYLEDYALQRYRTMSTARPRVEHLRGFFGGWVPEAMTADSVRRYQLHRRKQGAEAATINRETSALSRMFQLAIRRGFLERMPLFPNRLEENPPREGFFEHDEYLKVRAHASIEAPRSSRR
jgi:site-specific recombinase XerD